MLRLTLLAAAAALLASPAAAFRAENGILVRDEGGGRFMVGPAPGQSAGDSWCAAGDFVISRGMPTNTRIWRLSEPPRRQAEGVRFGLSSEGAASKTGLIVLGGRDASLSAIHAIQFCIRDYKEVED